MIYDTIHFMQRTVTSLEETKLFAEELVLVLKGKVSKDRATLLLLHGDLGAGKTTLTKAIAKTLGVKENVQSPTFVIQKNYETTDDVFKRLVHIDAYRIEDPKELLKIRINETLGLPKTLVIVEWPKQGGDVFANPDLELNLEFIDEQTRKITFDN